MGVAVASWVFRIVRVPETSVFSHSEVIHHAC